VPDKRLGFDPTVLAFSSDGKLLSSTATGADTLEAQQAKLEALQREIGAREERLKKLAKEKDEADAALAAMERKGAER
jgi:septal ring factor EnvC (AmiA/AmiB activator)